MRQHNEAAIKLGIISLSLSLGFLLLTDLVSGWQTNSKAYLLIGRWELPQLREVLVQAKCKHFPDELLRCQANIVATKLYFLKILEGG